VDAARAREHPAAVAACRLRVSYASAGRQLRVSEVNGNGAVGDGRRCC
jgi:hypothetical protein